MKYCKDTMLKYCHLLFNTTPRKLSEEQLKQVEDYIDKHKNDYRKSDTARQKAKERMLKQWQDKDYREQQSNKLKAFYSSKENKAEISRIRKKSWENNNERRENQKELMISLNKKKYTNNGFTTGELEREYGFPNNSINHLSNKLFDKPYIELSKEEADKVIETVKKGYVYSKSYIEEEIYNWIKEVYKGEVIHNNRSIIPPAELDIYIPEKKVALEYDGLYWHCSLNKDKDYHFNKTIACDNKGIRLIHIREDLWRDKTPIMKSIILSALGIYDKKIYARNTIAKEISRQEAQEFFNANHLKGFSNSDFSFYGLFYDNELVQCISFRKLFCYSNRGKTVELSRMATKLNTEVLGGFSKLLKYSINKEQFDEIESYVDRSIYTGNGYKDWELILYSKPGYIYTDGKQTYSRQKYMKSKCLEYWHMDDNLTEEQMCNAHGLFRLYDSGNLLLRYRSSNV